MYTLKFRIWHWLHAIVILGILATVFLRKTFLSWRTNSEILMTNLSEMNIEITKLQAKALAKAIRAGMWEWHIILGYALIFLILYRAYLFVFDESKKDTFSSLSLHKKSVHLSYYFIYIIILFMAISGMTVNFYNEIGIGENLAGDIKNIHEFVSHVLVIFVPLHIAGVVIADLTNENGLISGMINGKKLDKA